MNHRLAAIAVFLTLVLGFTAAAGCNPIWDAPVLARATATPR